MRRMVHNLFSDNQGPATTMDSGMCGHKRALQHEVARSQKVLLPELWPCDVRLSCREQDNLPVQS